MSSASSIFRPYRALGLISSDVSFAIKYKPHSREYNILVPIGERFNVYQVCFRLTRPPKYIFTHNIVRIIFSAAEPQTRRNK